MGLQITKPKRVLVVDDELLIRRTTALLLKKVNIDTILAENCEQCIALAKSEKLDLILLDIMMPTTDGWETLALLKATPDTSSIPVIIFSANDFALSEKKARELGATAVLRKPFQLAQVCRLIDSALGTETHHG